MRLTKGGSGAMFGTPQLVNEGVLGLPPSTKRLRLDPGQAPAHALHTISTGAAGGAGSPAGAALPPTPPSVIVLGPAGFVPADAQPPAASPHEGSASPRSPAAAASTPRASAAASPRGKRDSRSSLLSPTEKMDKVLKRFPRSFCDELGVRFLHVCGTAPSWAVCGRLGEAQQGRRCGLLVLGGATLDARAGRERCT